MVRAGLSRADAQSRVFVLDSRGLLLKDRDMEPYKLEFAQERAIIRGWEFEGDAPDLGAYEVGRPLPHYGPRDHGE